LLLNNHHSRNPTIEEIKMDAQLTKHNWGRPSRILSGQGNPREAPTSFL